MSRKLMVAVGALVWAVLLVCQVAAQETTKEDKEKAAGLPVNLNVKNISLESLKISYTAPVGKLARADAVVDAEMALSGASRNTLSSEGTVKAVISEAVLRQGNKTLKDVINAASSWIVPLLILGVPLYAYAARRIRVYESFIEGAKEGFTIGVRIMPYLVAILVAIGMFRASGAMDSLVWAIRPVVAWAGFPPEALPSSLMRSLSGSAASVHGSSLYSRM